MTSDPHDSPYRMQATEPTIESAYRPTTESAKSLTRALYLAFVPHDANSPTRKYLTAILFLTWAGATLLWHLGFEPPAQEVYWAMTVVVFSVMSHLWGFEYGVLSAYKVNDPQDSDRDSET